MDSLRTSIICAVTALMGITLLISPAFAQPCAHRWDVEFGASGADSEIHDLEVFDDGNGPKLFAAGWFRTVNNVPARGIAVWDGQEWSAVGGGFDEPGLVQALHVWDDGRGPALYAGGWFAEAGGSPASGVARWDGSRWEALGEGIGGSVFAFETFNDGRGEALYVGGTFGLAGGRPASRIARWDGENWETLGEGIIGQRGTAVYTMATFDDGEGIQLYVGGEMSRAGGRDVSLMARWNGREWSAIEGAQFSRIYDQWHIDQFQVFDDGSGPALFLTGGFGHDAGEAFLRWDGREWTAPGGGVEMWSSGHPDGMSVHDDGSGADLWFGGSIFRIVDSQQLAIIASWNGEAIRSLAIVPFRGWVITLASFNDGFGQALYAGGQLSLVNGQPVQNIVRWSAPHMALSHSPLRAGQRAAFATTCSTPGQRVNFLYSARGLGSVFIPQLGISIDLDTPHLIGHSIADPGGKAGLSRAIPPDASGRTLWLQAAEVGRKTEVVESVIE